jgi:hypothetical protein
MQHIVKGSLVKGSLAGPFLPIIGKLQYQITFVDGQNKFGEH